MPCVACRSLPGTTTRMTIKPAAVGVTQLLVARVTTDLAVHKAAGQQRGSHLHATNVQCSLQAHQHTATVPALGNSCLVCRAPRSAEQLMGLLLLLQRWQPIETAVEPCPWPCARQPPGPGQQCLQPCLPPAGTSGPRHRACGSTPPPGCGKSPQHIKDQQGSAGITPAIQGSSP
jgi:hypothetical protein